MCMHKNVPKHTVCKSSWLTTASSAMENKSNCSDDNWYDIEMDIRTGYHKVVSRVVSYDNISYKDLEFPNDIWIRKADWEISVKAAAFIVVVVLGLAGNTLLLSIVLRHRSIRTPTNLLIANMAVADLVTLLIMPWVFLCMDCFQNYILGEIGCKAQGFVECFLLLTGVLNLVAVSYDRLTAIVTPLEARLTVHGTHIIMVSTWVTGVILGMPLVFFRFYREREWLNFDESYCTEERVVMPIYWYVVIVFVVWLPLLVMTFCYSGLFFKLDQYEKKVLRREHPISVSYKTKVARTMFVVVVAFMVCRVPFTALIFLRSKMQQGTQTINQVVDAYNTLWFISHYLIIVNAAVDPLIYGLTNENFRRAFRATSVARCLFGASASMTIPRTPRTPRPQFNRLEPRDLCEKANDQQWFTVPRHLKGKTSSTDCYI